MAEEPAEPYRPASPASQTPVPDPTVLTTQATDRLEHTLRALVLSEIEHRRDLTDAEFELVKIEFKNLAERTAEQKSDTANALTAALAAQKEASAATTESSERSITKSELATNERIKSVETALTASAATLTSKLEGSVAALEGRINDARDRVSRIENLAVGGSESRVESRAANQAIYAFAGFLLTVLVIAGTLLAVFKN